jgi:integrase
VSNRSRINEIVCLSSVLRYAVKLKHAPRDLLDELAAIQRPKAEPPATLVWQPEEFRELIENAPVAFVPLLALGGLCGLRTSEVTRADWSHITPDGNHIAVITRKGRTPARRLVPLCPAAKEWLALSRQKEGPICETDREDIIVRKILASVNAARDERGVKERFQWRENALRHSYGTYRVALTGDIARTALEMGNSPQMIVQHYMQLRTKEEAEAFFRIAPAAGDGVIPFTKAGTGT